MAAGYLLYRDAIHTKQLTITMILTQSSRIIDTYFLKQIVDLIQLTLEVLDLHLKNSKIISRSILQMNHRIAKKTDQLRDELRKGRNGD